MRGFAAAPSPRRHRPPLDCASVCFWLAERRALATGLGRMTVSILFVCMGNICRSPLAEGAFRAEADRLGLAVEVDSAGTGGWHAGEPPDARAIAAARRGGVDIAASARAQGGARRFRPVRPYRRARRGESRRPHRAAAAGEPGAAVAAARPCRRPGRAGRSPIPIMAGMAISTPPGATSPPGRAGSPRRCSKEGMLMSLVFHGHPLSSYCWKVLIALYENGTRVRAEAGRSRRPRIARRVRRALAGGEDAGAGGPGARRGRGRDDDHHRLSRSPLSGTGPLRARGSGAGAQGPVLGPDLRPLRPGADAADRRRPAAAGGAKGPVRSRGGPRPAGDGARRWSSRAGRTGSGRPAKISRWPTARRCRRSSLCRQGGAVRRALSQCAGACSSG